MKTDFINWEKVPPNITHIRVEFQQVSKDAVTTTVQDWFGKTTYTGDVISSFGIHIIERPAKRRSDKRHTKAREGSRRIIDTPKIT